MVGIVGYGVYIPRYRIKVEEIARIWGEDPESIKSGLRVAEKTGATLAILLGQKEREAGVAIVKDLARRSQESLPRLGLAAAVRARL